MGFYEYDRIRAKNKINNEAYAEYERLLSNGFNHNDIATLCKTNTTGNDNSSRNEMYLTILKIVGRSNDEGSS